jgi:hypothetical protein
VAVPAAGTPATESRSIWRCEPCNAFHIGGIDLTSTDENGGTWTAACGTVYRIDQPSSELWETPLTAEDPAPWIWDGDATEARAAARAVGTAANTTAGQPGRVRPRR